MQNYFTKNCLGQNNFGKFIEKELNGKIFDEKTISTLYELSKKQLDIISPNYFQRINKDVAIFVFVIKGFFIPLLSTFISLLKNKSPINVNSQEDIISVSEKFIELPPMLLLLLLYFIVKLLKLIKLLH